MAQPTQLTQSELDYVLNLRKQSPFERLTKFLKKIFIQIFWAIVITFTVAWILVAFTDFKLPFLYSENKTEYRKTTTGALVKTTRKQVILDLKPQRKDAIVIKEGKK